MEKTSFSVLFYIRKKKRNRQGAVPITLRITVNGVRSEAYTHRYIRPELWNKEKGRATAKSASCRELNLYLDTVQARIFALRTSLEAEGARESLSPQKYCIPINLKSAPDFTLCKIGRFSLSCGQAVFGNRGLFAHGERTCR